MERVKGKRKGWGNKGVEHEKSYVKAKPNRKQKIEDVQQNMSTKLAAFHRTGEHSEHRKIWREGKGGIEPQIEKEKGTH